MRHTIRILPLCFFVAAPSCALDSDVSDADLQTVERPYDGTALSVRDDADRELLAGTYDGIVFRNVAPLLGRRVLFHIAAKSRGEGESTWRPEGLSVEFEFNGDAKHWELPGRVLQFDGDVRARVSKQFSGAVQDLTLRLVKARGARKTLVVLVEQPEIEFSSLDERNGDLRWEIATRWMEQELSDSGWFARLPGNQLITSQMVAAGEPLDQDVSGMLGLARYQVAVDAGVPTATEVFNLMGSGGHVPKEVWQPLVESGKLTRLYRNSARALVVAASVHEADERTIQLRLWARNLRRERPTSDVVFEEKSGQAQISFTALLAGTEPPTTERVEYLFGTRGIAVRRSRSDTSQEIHTFSHRAAPASGD